MWIRIHLSPWIRIPSADIDEGKTRFNKFFFFVENYIFVKRRLNSILWFYWPGTGSVFINFCGSGSGYNHSGSTSLLLGEMASIFPDLSPAWITEQINGIVAQQEHDPYIILFLDLFKAFDMNSLFPTQPPFRQRCREGAVQSRQTSR